MIKKEQYDKLLDRAYQYARFRQKNKEARELLELSLRYGFPHSPNYAQKRKLYIQDVLEDLKRDMTLFRKYQIINTLDKALDIVPDSYEFLSQRGQVYLSTEISYQQGMEDLEKSLKLNPRQPIALLFRGKENYRREEYKLALIDLEACVAMEPTIGEAQLLRGLVYQKLGQTMEAIKQLRLVRQKFPRYSKAAHKYLMSLQNHGH